MPGNRAPSTTLSSSTSASISKAISFLGKSLRSHCRALRRGPTGPVFQLWMTSRTILLKRSLNWANRAQDRNRQIRTISKAAPRPPKPKRHLENHSLKRVRSLIIDERKLRKSKTPLVQRLKRVKWAMWINSVLLKRKLRRRWRIKQKQHSGMDFQLLVWWPRLRKRMLI